MVETLNARWIPRLPDPKGADPELHMGFGLFDLLVETPNEFVHLITSPIIATEFTASLSVFCPCRIVGEWNFVDRIGIEVIIDVDAIDIVTFDDIEEDVQCMLSGLRFTWIEPQVRGFVVAITFDQIGVGFADVAG